jgi:hypothetical protein
MPTATHVPASSLVYLGLPSSIVSCFGTRCSIRRHSASASYRFRVSGCGLRVSGVGCHACRVSGFSDSGWDRNQMHRARLYVPQQHRDAHAPFGAWCLWFFVMVCMQDVADACNHTCHGHLQNAHARTNACTHAHVRDTNPKQHKHQNTTNTIDFRDTNPMVGAFDSMSE